MDDFLYWFGVIHVAAYALASFLLVTWMFIEWLLKRMKLKAKLIRALFEYYKAKRNFIGG